MVLVLVMVVVLTVEVFLRRLDDVEDEYEDEDEN